MEYLEKQRVAQLVHEFLAFYGMQRFNICLQEPATDLFLVTWIESTPSHTYSHTVCLRYQRNITGWVAFRTEVAPNCKYKLRLSLQFSRCTSALRWYTASTNNSFILRVCLPALPMNQRVACKRTTTHYSFFASRKSPVVISVTVLALSWRFSAGAGCQRTLYCHVTQRRPANDGTLRLNARLSASSCHLCRQRCALSNVWIGLTHGIIPDVSRNEIILTLHLV
jgi:hypothetical protein